MAERRLPREVVIMPTGRECTPRFGNRTAVEHDMADAFQTRLRWAQENAAFIKDLEDKAAHKAGEKIKKEFREQQAGKLSLLMMIQFVATAEILLLKWIHVI